MSMGGRFKGQREQIQDSKHLAAGRQVRHSLSLRFTPRSYFSINHNTHEP